jgi:hypothetical protein
MKNSGLPVSNPSRRLLLQAAGAIAVAGLGVAASQGEAAAATSVPGDGDGLREQHMLATYPVPAGVRTNDSFSVQRGDRDRKDRRRLDGGGYLRRRHRGHQRRRSRIGDAHVAGRMIRLQRGLTR